MKIVFPAGSRILAALTSEADTAPAAGSALLDSRTFNIKIIKNKIKIIDSDSPKTAEDSYRKVSPAPAAAALRY
jgi:hypothetical protein